MAPTKLRAQVKSQEEPFALGLEYYQPVFNEIHRDAHHEIRAALIEEPQQRRRRYLEGFRSGIAANRETGWEFLKQYSEHVEAEIAAIVRGHSPFYWLHLYRRIAPALSKGMPSKNDATTAYLTRLNLETAFAKYGSTTNTTDIRVSSDIDPTQILGGLFLGALERFGAALKLEAPLPTYLTRQHVLVDFTKSDFINVYRLEGLAYEYWRANATMRSIGKGATLVVHAGNFADARTDEFDELIQSYDLRGDQPFATSLMGMTFHQHPDAEASPKAGIVFLPVYNVHRAPMRGKRFLDSRTGKPFIPNFHFTRVPFDSFVQAHAFASGAFAARKGFSLESLHQVLFAIGYCPLLEMTFSADESRRLATLMRYSQRAYMTLDVRKTPLASYVRDACATLVEARVPQYSDLPEVELNNVLKYLTLTPDRQDSIALWSHGPRPLFIPHGDAVIVDLHAIPAILYTMFVGVRYKADERGYRFEDAFRKVLQHHKFDVLPYRELRAADGRMRETDAAVRVGSTLVLFECRSIERPLDYEIGSPKTIDYRVAELAKKVTQAHSLREFIELDRVGTNYDFRWATRIVCAAVSPFKEWIWSQAETLWFDKGRNIPIIMTVPEALEVLGALSSKATKKRTSKRPRRRTRSSRRKRK